jgi:spermidine synthase
VAPLAFNSYIELPICLVACAALAVVVLRTYPDPDWLRNLLPVSRFVVACAVVAGASCIIFVRPEWITTPVYQVARAISKGWSPSGDFDRIVFGAALALGSLIALAAFRADWKLRWMRGWGQWGAVGIELFAVALAGYTGYQTLEANSGNRLMVRNFYGGLKVHDSGPLTDLDSTRGLTHGTINHGEQFLNPARTAKPTTYYGPDTGVGLAVRSKQATGPVRLGVIGLGTGTMAAYGRAGDYIRFYEINPLVYRMSVPADPDVPPQFTFVRRSQAIVDVAMGDARLSLEREAPQNFDVLAVDAFSSDSIPVHLLTKEAMALYFRHLKPDGILAVHISNRYLDLEPVVEGESRALNKVARVVDTDDVTEEDVFAATWVLVTSPQTGFAPLVEDASNAAKATRKVRTWTDDYSNLFQILK